MAETKGQGEYRNLTPQEIGHAVITFRKVRTMKQLTLALDAGVDERTVQRIERGEKVGDDTLRKVAKALGMKEESFLGPRYVSTRQEAVAEVERTLSEMLVVEASDLATVRDCDAILGTHGYILNDEHVGADQAEKVAALRDLLTDHNDIYTDLPHTQRLKACQIILDEIRKIEDTGYRTRYGVYTTDDQYQVSIVMFLPRTDDHLCKMSQFVVPRNFEKMARESFGGGKCGGYTNA